jgi:hypothetical protein
MGDYMGNSQTKASNKYHAEKYDRLYPFVPKGRKAEIQAVADAQGESLNDFIVKAIDERMERFERDKPFAPPPGEWCEGCKKLGGRQFIPAHSEPEEMRPWCYVYGCELEGTEDKPRKCLQCTTPPTE